MAFASIWSMKPNSTLLVLIGVAWLGGACAFDVESRPNDIPTRAPPEAVEPGGEALHDGNRDPCFQSVVFGDDGDVIAAPVECALLDIDMGRPPELVERLPDPFDAAKPSDSISDP